MASLGLLVLRCDDLERTRAFYDALGLTFTPEQHGAGPRHFSAKLGSLVLELYPASAAHRPETGLRLGLSISGATAGQLVDPDGRIVELSQE